MPKPKQPTPQLAPRAPVGAVRRQPPPRPTPPPIPVARPLVQLLSLPTNRSILRYLLLGIGILAACSAVIAAVLKFKTSAPGDGIATAKERIIVGNARNLNNRDEMAFRIILDETIWTPANDIRKRLSATTAWRNIGPGKDGWFAVAVQDYGRANPRESELLRTGIERLDQYYEGALELAEKAEPDPLSEGQEQRPHWQRLVFKGQLNSVIWWGYMYTVAYQGFGYWLYIAAPTKEEAEALFAPDLQGAGHGFTLSTDRQGWRELPAKIESFTTANGALTISAPEGIFEKHPAKDEDERAELHLFAKYRKEQDNRKNADVLVVALPKQADANAALQQAKKHLEDKKHEESKDYTLENAGEKSSEQGIAGPVGNRRGIIAEYKLMRGAAPARFWIVAVANSADKSYVIRCDSTWENRQVWRADFLSLLNSVKIKGQAPRTQ